MQSKQKTENVQTFFSANRHTERAQNQTDNTEDVHSNSSNHIIHAAAEKQQKASTEQ